ncbi:hypothetical protein diail_10517 [Diaporthe ilicicola]|nr:hypothetical protein diail_10517 [Diaporthe ilicicola]
MYGANDSRGASSAYNQQFIGRSTVGTWLWSQLWAEASTQPVYTYLWDHAPPNQPQGAYHESEINYVLNNLYNTDMPWTEEDYEIAEIINAYWVNFIKTGSPNGGNLTQWPAASADGTTVQHVAVPIGVVLMFWTFLLQWANEKWNMDMEIEYGGP